MDPWSLPNEKLIKELTQHNVQIPKSPSKKLLVDLYRKHVSHSGGVDKSPKNVSPSKSMNVQLLSDEELLNECKKRNISVGPVTATTRSIIEKKLQKHINGTSTRRDVEKDDDDSDAEDDDDRFRDEQGMDVDEKEEEEYQQSGRRGGAERNVNFNHRVEVEDALEQERRYHYSSLVDSEEEGSYNATGQSRYGGHNLSRTTGYEARKPLADDSWTKRDDTSRSGGGGGASRGEGGFLSGYLSRNARTDDLWNASNESERDGGKGGLRPRESISESKWSSSYSRDEIVSPNSSSWNTSRDAAYNRGSSRTPPPKTRSDPTDYSPPRHAASTTKPPADKPFVPIWCQLLILILFAGFLFLVIHNMHEAWTNPLSSGN